MSCYYRSEHKSPYFQHHNIKWHLTKLLNFFQKIFKHIPEVLHLHEHRSIYPAIVVKYHLDVHQ